MSNVKKVPVSSEWTKKEKLTLKFVIHSKIEELIGLVNGKYCRGRLKKILHPMKLLDIGKKKELESHRSDFEDFTDVIPRDWSLVERKKLWWFLYFELLSQEIAELIEFFDKDSIYHEILAMLDLCIALDQDSAMSLEKNRADFSEFIAQVAP